MRSGGSWLVSLNEIKGNFVILSLTMITIHGFWDKQQLNKKFLNDCNLKCFSLFFPFFLHLFSPSFPPQHLRSAFCLDVCLLPEASEWSQDPSMSSFSLYSMRGSIGKETERCKESQRRRPEEEEQRSQTFCYCRRCSGSVLSSMLHCLCDPSWRGGCIECWFVCARSGQTETTSKVNPNDVKCECEDEPAIVHCASCDSFMGERCLRTHAKSKANANHVLVKVDDYFKGSGQTARVLFCQYHPGSEIDTYCKTDNHPLCSKCVVPAHNSHNLVQLKDISLDFSAEITKALQSSFFPFFTWNTTLNVYIT